MSSEIFWFSYNLKTVEHRKFNYGYNMTIIKSIIYADFEEPRSRDRDLGTLNLRKNCHFCLENLLIRL